MHIQFLIEDMSGEVLIRHVMRKLLIGNGSVTYDCKAFKGIGGFKKNISANVVYKGGLKKFKKDCPSYGEIGKYKSKWADEIGKYMNIDNNDSPSFNYFLSQVRMRIR